MTLNGHRNQLVEAQAAEQAKSFGQYDDERYELISQAIDATDALAYAQTLPDRRDIKGRNMLELAQARWVRVLKRLHGHEPSIPPR